MKSTTINLLLIALLLLSGCSSQLYPIKKGNKFGYENKKKELVIPAKYKEASAFKEGFAKVGLGYKVVDSLWNEPIFEDKGHWSIDKYQVVKYTFIDGKDSIFPLKLDEAKSFSKGLAAARIKGNWGYLNKKGEWQIKPQYASATNFDGKTTEVIKESADGLRWYYLEINKKGVIVKNDKKGIRKPDWFDSIPDWRTLMASGNIYTRLTDYESAYNYYSAAARRIDQIEQEDTLNYMELCQEMAYYSAMRVEEDNFDKYDALAEKKMNEILASDITRRRMILLKHIDYLFKLSEIRDMNMQKEKEINALERLLDVVKRSKTEDISLYWDIEERLEELKK